jgi:hypothetical protein
MGFLDRFRRHQTEVTQFHQHPWISASPDLATPDDSPTTSASWYVPKGDPHRFETPTGVPDLHLIAYRDAGGSTVMRLCEDSTGLLVSPTDMRLPKIGIYVSNLRGEVYHQAGCKAGDFRPGAPVTLRREPSNEYDKNAIAVYDRTGQHLAAYVNKQKARMLAKLLDAGANIAAISLTGTPAGKPATGIAVLAAAPELLQHLLQQRPAHLPPPIHQA